MRESLSRLWPSRGFTLAELLVVIVVVGVLAAIAVPLFLSQRGSAEDAAARSAVRNLASAQELFFTNSDGVYAADEVALAGEGFVGSDKVDVDVATGGSGDEFVVCAAHQNGGDVWAWSSAQPTVQPVGEVDFGSLSDIDDCDPAAAAAAAAAEAAAISALQADIDEGNWGAEHYGGFLAGVIDTNQPDAILAEDEYQTPLRYALIVSPRSLQTNAEWGTATGPVDEANTRWDGLAAQEALVAPDGNTTFPAFHYSHNLTDFGGDEPTGDGYGVSAPGEVSRWYLPALDELTAAYWNLKPTMDNNATGTRGGDFPDDDFNRGELFSSVPQRPPFTSGTPGQTDVTDFQEGGDQEFIEVGGSSRIFRSASRHSSLGGWVVSFESGFPFLSSQTNTLRVRPFRRVVL